VTYFSPTRDETVHTVVTYRTYVPTSATVIFTVVTVQKTVSYYSHGEWISTEVTETRTVARSIPTILTAVTV
jgi:hypothetical protein